MLDQCLHFNVLTDSASLQLMYKNVPVGEKAKFWGISSSRKNCWLGEVHFLSGDIRPSASGDDLRAGTAKEEFVNELQKLYSDLERKADRKSAKINVKKKLVEGLKAAKQLKKGSQSGLAEKHKLQQKVATAVRLVEVTGKGKSTAKGKEEMLAVQLLKTDPVFKNERNTIRLELKQLGALDEFATEVSTKKSKKSAKKAKTMGSSKLMDSSALDQSAAVMVAATIPRLEELELTPAQFAGVLQILKDIWLSGAY